MKRFWFILAAFLGLAVQAVPASADIVYTLKCSTVACGGSTTYGTVTLSTPVNLTSVHVSVQLTSNYQFGGNNTDSFLWNGLTNDTLVVSNVTGGGFDSGNITNGDHEASVFTSGSNNEFDYLIQRSNNMGAPTSLSFDVTKSGGLTLANFATDNDGAGFFFAAQIRTTSSNDLFYVASNTVGVKVPEPGTWTLSIAGMAGLAGLVMLGRRRKWARVA